MTDLVKETHPRVLFLVPARGGSKGIPKKNIVPLAGRPMIAWTLNAARNSKYAGRLVVTTDSVEIAEIARSLGAEVPFLRPAALAADDVASLDSVLHAQQWLANEESYRPDYLVLLQPTSPLRASQDIDDAIDLALAKDAPAVVSVSPVSCHPYWVKKIGPAGQLEDFVQLAEPISRRQELPAAFGLNGAIYLIKPEILEQQRTWYPDPTYAFVMPPERSLDVDEPWDRHLAELILLDRPAAHDRSSIGAG